MPKSLIFSEAEMTKLHPLSNDREKKSDKGQRDCNNVGTKLLLGLTQGQCSWMKDTAEG